MHLLLLHHEDFRVCEHIHELPLMLHRYIYRHFSEKSSLMRSTQTQQDGYHNGK